MEKVLKNETFVHVQEVYGENQDGRILAFLYSVILTKIEEESITEDFLFEQKNM